MPTYHAITTIAAPIESVYARLADLPGHPEWSSDPLEIVQTEDKSFSSSARSKGKTITATLRVLEQRPPEVFAFEAIDLTGSWINRFTLSPTSGGTRVRRQISGKLTGTQLLLFWLVLFPIKKPNARRSLEKLKELVERDAG